MKVLIITGGNKGIGKGIVEAYYNNGYEIISIARNKNKDAFYNSIQQIEFDLAELNDMESLMSTIFNQLPQDQLSSITLINNAGTLGEITTFDKKPIADIIQNIQLNTTAVLVLTSLFLKLSKNLSCRKRVITISSGAGKNPYFGWVTYCSSKAAIDMMTRAVALEQNLLKFGTKILAISPGVVDTEMQNLIRQSNEADFIDVEKFIQYKNTGGLASAQQVGTEIYKIDHDDLHPNGALAHVNELR